MGKQTKITRSAKGEMCLTRIPGVCNFNPETTVYAHKNGGGSGTKSDDLHGSYACFDCHAWLDGGFAKKETPPTHSHVDVMFRDDYFVIASGSVNVCDFVTGWMKQKLDKHFLVSVLRVNDPLSELGLALFESGASMLEVDNVQLDNQVSVVMHDKTKIDVAAADYSSRLVELLSTAEKVKTMRIRWGRVAAKVKSDFSKALMRDVLNDRRAA